MFYLPPTFIDLAIYFSLTLSFSLSLSLSHAHTHTQTHTQFIVVTIALLSSSTTIPREFNVDFDTTFIAAIEN